MEYYDLEQPNDLTKKEKEDAMGSYLMMFAAMGAGLPLPIINLIAAVVYYFIQQKNTRFVRFHTLQSLWSQFPTTIVNAGAVFWALQIYVFKNYQASDEFFGYLIMMAILNLIYFVFSIVGAVQARKGRMYYFLFFGKLAYHQVYKVRPDDLSKENVNLPPK